MMVVDNKLNLKDVVYLRTDKDQLPRLVSAISVREDSIRYELSCGTDTSWHCDYECSYEKDVVLTTDN